MRDYRIDLLRILAMLAVLGIHCFGGKGNAADYVNGFCRFSVPVFVMISAICCGPKIAGATPLTVFYKPRFKRVGIPLLAFSFLYMVENVLVGATIGTVLKSFVAGKPSYHLWFGFMILGVYVFLPFIMQLAAQLNHVLLTAVSCFVILMTWDVGGGLYSILPFVAYALIGILLLPALSKLATVSSRIRISIGVLCLLIYITCACIAGSIGEQRAYTYTSLYSLLGSVSVLVSTFALLPQSMGKRLGGLLVRLSSLTFGVYLLHVIAIRGIVRVFPLLAEPNVASAAVLWGSVSAVSFAVTFVAAQIPFARDIFGINAKEKGHLRK